MGVAPLLAQKGSPVDARQIREKMTLLSDRSRVQKDFLLGTPIDNANIRTLIVQYVGPIAEMLIKDVQGKAAEVRARGRAAHFLIMDGQDTARVLFAYGRL